MDVSPPTDNLYKFFALSCLILCIFCFWIDSKMRSDVMAVNQQLMQRWVETEQQLAAPDISATQASEALAKKKVIESDTKFFKQQVDDFKEIRKLLFWAAPISLGFSLVGFCCWYWKTQRHEDELLELKVLEARRTAKAAEPKQEPKPVP